MEELTVCSFFVGGFDEEGLIHASELAASPSDLGDDVVDSDAVGGLELRKAFGFDCLPIGCSEEFGQQLLVCLALDQDDKLISRIIQVNSLIQKLLLSQHQISRQDSNLDSILRLLSILNKISRKRLLIINIKSERINPRVVASGKEVRIAAVYFKVFIDPLIWGGLDVAEEELAVEDDVEVAEHPH